MIATKPCIATIRPCDGRCRQRRGGACTAFCSARTGSCTPSRPCRLPPLAASTPEVVAEIARSLPQGALGYVVRAPMPGTREGHAWQMLNYIFCHDYSGRLGRSAIGDKGLAYYIASEYRTDGRRGWIALFAGVDPAKADPLEDELKQQLDGLVTDPPSAAEIDAARRHLLGRDLSAAQSNEELADRLARQFVETGGLRNRSALAAALDSIRPGDIAAAAAAFGRGTNCA